MRIEDRFSVSLPLDESWKILLDVERIAPCMPGAQLQEVDGDTYRGIVKVKLGAVTAQFKGTVRFTEVDEEARRVVLRAEGREVRGQGNAAATVTATLHEADDGATAVAIDTDLSITGRMAQFGRGVLADVSSKLLGDFARCLEEDLAGKSQRAAEAETAAPQAASEAPAAVPQPSAAEAPAAPPQASEPRRRIIQSASPEPVDLLAVAGPSVAQRALPAALVAVLLLLAATRSTAKRWALALAGGGIVAAMVNVKQQS